MDDEQPGLRPRLAHVTRRLAAQHEYLDALLATTRRALERSAPAEAREAVQALRGALDAHFALEEQVHFSALHGLDPAQDRRIEVFVLEHRALRDRLQTLAGRVTREPRDAVARDFVDLGAALREHETEEEILFDQVTAAGAEGGSPPRGR